MRRILSFILTLGIVLSSFATLPVFAEVKDYKILVSEDTFSDVTNSGGNSGSLDYVYTRNVGGQYRNIYMKIDASSFTGITAESVKLHLYSQSWDTTYQAQSGSFKIYALTDKAWSESDVTYNNPPSETGMVEIAEVTDFAIGKHYNIDLTSYFNGLSDKILSLKIVGSGAGVEPGNVAGRYRFRSREWTNADEIPYLTVRADKPVINVSDVSLDNDTLDFEMGDAAKTLKAAVNPTEADDKSVTWTSSDEAVATVVNGVVTPVSVGNATITVKTNDGNLTDTCLVTVNPRPIVHVASVSLDKHSLILQESGEPDTLTATVFPANADDKSVVWSSSNESIVSVINGVVTPHNVGIATITVKSNDGELTDTCTVTVTEILFGNRIRIEKKIDADSYVTFASGMENDAPGSSVELYARGAGGQNRQIILKSDLSEYAGAVVERAILKVTGKAYELAVAPSASPYPTPVPAPVNVYGMQSTDWSEITASRNTICGSAGDIPASSGILATRTFTADAPLLYTFDVTDYFKNNLDNNMVSAWKLTTTATDRVKFYSREAGEETAPKIEYILSPFTLIENAGQLTGKVNVVANKADKKGAMIVATYDADGSMTSVSFQEANVVSGDKTALAVNLANGGAYSKAYYWDSLSDMKPYYETADINKASEANQSAAANGIISINGQIASISGKAEPNELISLEILNPNVTAVTQPSDLVHVYQVTADNDGKYSFKFKMPDSAVSGTYTIRVGGSKSAVRESAFRYLSSYSQSAVFSEIANASTAEELLNIFVSYNDTLGLGQSGIFAEKFINLPIAKKLELFEEIKNQKGSINTSQSASAVFSELCALKNLEWSANWIDVHETILLSQNGLSISYADFVKYSGMPDTSAIDKLFIGGKYTKSSFLSAFSAALYPSSSSDSGGPVSTYKGGGGGGGFIPLTSEPTKDPSETNEIFRDLSNYDWAKESIISLYNKNIINGKDTGIFAPQDDISRAEFLKIIILGLGLYDETAVSSFNDVSSDEWYYKYVASAQKNAIVNGDSFNNFNASDKISRQDMAVILYRASGIVGITMNKIYEPNEFADNSAISNYATEAFSTMQQAGIITGFSDNTAGPLLNANRAQAAVMINRLLEN